MNVDWQNQQKTCCSPLTNTDSLGYGIYTRGERKETKVTKRRTKTHIHKHENVENPNITTKQSETVIFVGYFYSKAWLLLCMLMYLKNDFLLHNKIVLHLLMEGHETLTYDDNYNIKNPSKSTFLFPFDNVGEIAGCCF